MSTKFLPGHIFRGFGRDFSIFTSKGLFRAAGSSNTYNKNGGPPMAEVMDVDPDLRGLARRVPEDVRSHMTPAQLTLRCQEAAVLLGDAETARNSSKADRFRSKANRLLKAMSPDAFRLAMSALEAELRQARLDGADMRARGIQYEMMDLERRNPQVSDESLLAAAEAALARLTIPPVPTRNSFAMTKRKARKRSR